MKFMNSIILWVPMMRPVLWSCVILTVLGTYFFGWRAFVVVLIANLFGFLTEYYYLKLSKSKEKVNSSVFVSSSLYALTLPPLTPFWVVSLGIIIGILFGKMVFGGFGRNIFNPAIVARIFVYLSFPQWLASSTVWTKNLGQYWGGFVHWIGKSIQENLTDGVSRATPVEIMQHTIFSTDAVSSATPQISHFNDLFSQINFWDYIIGTVSGSIGSTSLIAIFCIGIYLVWIKKVASKEIVLSAFGIALLTEVVFKVFSLGKALGIIGILTGALFFGFFLMATDPVTGTQTSKGKWIYGGLIGFLTVFIRSFSSYPEGMMFAILIGNSFAPFIEYLVNSKKKARS